MRLERHQIWLKKLSVVSCGAKPTFNQDHMRIIALLCFAAFTYTANAQDEVNQAFIEDYLAKWENAEKYTVDVAEAMPAEFYDFKPTEGQRAFHEQLTHMCGNMIWLSTSNLGGKGLATAEEETPPTGKEEVIALLKETFGYVRETISGFDPETIDEEVDFFAGPMSRRRVLLLMTDHLAHHRGQLVVYLRLQGIEPPRYRGW